MRDILNRWMYSLGFIVVIVFFGSWFTGNEDKIEVPELPSALEKVQCIPAPENDRHAKANRALLEYDTYGIYQVCIPLHLMSEKETLKCGYDEFHDKSICDDSAILQQHFVHGGFNEIYATDEVTSRTPNAKSEVDISFSQQVLPIHEASFEYYTTETHVTQGIITPSRLRLRDDPVCQSALNGKAQGESEVIRDHSYCYVSAAFGALKINLEINILANSNNKLTRQQQIDEINFWLKFVDKLVVDN